MSVDQEREIPLSGGNISSVVRIGETVRRTVQPWSSAVHGLLRHLEAQGFEEAPRFLGFDAEGREILSFIPGDVGTYPLKPYMWSDQTLVDIARLLRRFHDATVAYTPPNAPWQFVFPDPARHEVICHNDVAPYNTVFADERPCALIDFDTAGPGPRLWDIAYAVYRFVPLGRDTPLSDGTIAPYDAAVHAPERRRRLHLFASAYGGAVGPGLIDTVERRLQATCTLLIERAATGDAVYQQLIDDGHLAHYQQEMAFINRHRQGWEIGALNVTQEETD